METVQTEPDFASRGAFLAYHYREDGPEFLKALLAELVKDGKSRREYMQEVACELKALHHKAADLVREAAARCPSITDMADCPFLAPRYANSPGNELNIRMWRRGQQMQAERIYRECAELLRRAGVDPDWIDGNSD